MKKYLNIIGIILICTLLIGCEDKISNHMTIKWKYDENLMPDGGFDRSSDSEPYGKFYKTHKMSYNEFVDYIKKLDTLGYKINSLYSDYDSIQNIKYDDEIELKVCNSNTGDDYLCFIIDWTDELDEDYSLKLVPNNF
ncbi:MAG: hypothetical protein IJO32_07625 [Bacilli bacterium]|nr:hypothetical protein [Bacilli bacterium]